MVTLRADGVPLEKVLEELSRRAGFELFLYAPAGESVTAEFREVPLEKALGRLLPNHGFLFRRGAEGGFSLRAVAVVPGGVRDREGGFAFRRVARLPYGSEAGEVGRVDIPGVQRQGPQSFAPGPGGDIYLADTVNRRLQVFGPDGEPAREIPLPFAPRDIAVSGEGEVFVLDDPGRTIVRVGPDGERREDISLPGGLAARLDLIRSSGENLILRTREGGEYELPGPEFPVPAILEKPGASPRGSRLASGEFCRVRKVSGEEAEVAIIGPEGEVKDTISVPFERLASISFLGAERSGDIYLQVERVRPGGVGVDLEVLVMNSAGIMVDKIENVPNNYSNWTSRLLQLDPRGDVYQMLPSPEAVELNRWSRQRRKRLAQ